MVSKLLSLLVFICFNVGLFAQGDNVLFRIDEEPIMVSEFLRVYHKNSGVVVDNGENTIDNYFELFINYKLKIEEAKALELDTLKSYVTELSAYKEQLLQPYLKDPSFVDSLVKEAFERSLLEIKSSHILVRVESSKDSLNAYNKIHEARSNLLNGGKFNETAKSYSEDPSVQFNGGDLGYSTVFDMVYLFENAIYNTRVGAVSKPFKTKFGYHVVKIRDVRKARGEVEVSHILIKGDTKESKVTIEELYNRIINGGEEFGALAKSFSEDKFSAKDNGRLERFGSGKMVEEFEEVSFGLVEEGDLSKPFRTAYGWHIVKLLNKYPVGDFKEEQKKLYDKVKKSDRIALANNSIFNKVKENYNLKVVNASLEPFEKNLKIDPYLNDVLITIDDIPIFQNDFELFLKGRDYTVKLFNEFKDYVLLEHHKLFLLENNEEISQVYKEYQEGLLLFELLQRRIWSKSSNLKEIKKFYDSHKSKYMADDGTGNVLPLSKIKVDVINDLQKSLEGEWIKELHKKYKLEVDKEVLNSLNKNHK